MSPPLRPTWFEIDLTAAADNLRAVRRLVGPARKIFAVVKADAYGFGSVALGRTFVQSGADALAVADLADGIRLREAGITVPVLVYPNALPDAASDVVAAGLTPAITGLETARAYAAVAREPVGVFVKVDVGLERLGVPADQAVKTIIAIQELPRLRLAGVCTHLHVPAGADPAYVRWQFARFTAVLDALAAHGIDVPVRLAASSPLVLDHPDTYLNAVDPGRMLYGVEPADRAGRVPLRSVFGALKSRLVEVKALTPRERFADAAPFPIAASMRLGVIPIGAGDGLHHLAPDRALVRGRRVSVLARPSLEHTRLDLTAVPEARVGDEVVLIGRQGAEEITCEQVATRSRLDPLHLALAIGPRVARVYGYDAGRVPTPDREDDAMTTTKQTVEEEYAATHAKSAALYERAGKLMPSGAAHDGRVFTPFPFYVERADGAYKWDVDGHRYVDCWSGHGAMILGHNHPAVTRAIVEQAPKGTHYSACSELEIRWAELIRECVPGAERVRFTMTGTETTALAIRVARAATGRTKIVKFQGHFHGIHDAVVAAVRDPFEIPMSAGVPPEVLKTTLVARPNRIDEVKALLDEHEVAAVILEPAAGRSMVVPTKPEFLRQLRELTRAKNVVLIFDEVVTGFRLAAGGAQEYFGVTADLTCLAKAVAGGLPGAALVGRADLLEGIAMTGDAKRDRTRRVADQGTYSGTPLVAAAGIAALEILKTGEVQKHINRLGDRVREGMNQVLAARKVVGCVYGHASVFRIFLGATAKDLGLDTWQLDEARLERGMGPLGGKLHLAMLLNGVDYNRGTANGWLNGAMTDADVDRMVEAFDRSLGRLQQDGALP